MYAEIKKNSGASFSSFTRIGLEKNRLVGVLLKSSQAKVYQSGADCIGPDQASVNYSECQYSNYNN